MLQVLEWTLSIFWLSLKASLELWHPWDHKFTGQCTSELTPTAAPQNTFRDSPVIGHCSYNGASQRHPAGSLWMRNLLLRGVVSSWVLPTSPSSITGAACSGFHWCWTPWSLGIPSSSAYSVIPWFFGGRFLQCWPLAGRLQCQDLGSATGTAGKD